MACNMTRFLSPLAVMLPRDGAINEPLTSSAAVIDLMGILLSIARLLDRSNTIVTAAFGFEEVPIEIPPLRVVLFAVMPFNGP